MVQENVGITVDGYAYKTAIESFNSAKKTIGGITAVGDADAAIDDDQIIVHVDVTGAKQNAQAEVIFTNDMFLSMESDKEEAKNAGIDKAVTQIAAQEEPEADDTELVAVIAAAIAASEGAVSTDGFVVRSIRKVR